MTAKPPDTDSAETHEPERSRTGTAFLLAQVGAHTAAGFAHQLSALGLQLPHAGILRILGGTSPMTQQALATLLGAAPSRLVGLLDDLESRGLLERRPRQADRRSHALHLTETGLSMLQEIGRIAGEHQRALLTALTEEEQRELGRLLQRVADQQGLVPGVHPGFARPDPKGGGERS